MTGNPRARLARLFDLALAYDRSGAHRPQFLAPGMTPAIEGVWTIYRFSAPPTPEMAADALFRWPDARDEAA